LSADPRRDRLERLTNLVLALLDTPRPLTLRQITEEVDGYPAGKETARQAFERDKRALRDLGIPVTNVPLDGEEQVGYLIKPSDYYLPELDLEEDEAQALSFAVAAVQLGGSAGRDALSALGHGTGARLDVPLAVLPEAPALGPVHQALRDRAVLSFDYRGRPREVEPYGLTFREAAWYLVGRDRTAGDNGEVRTFRVDRFESEPVSGPPGAFERPSDLDLREEINLLPFGGEPGAPVAELGVDARLARQVAAIVPERALGGFDDEGAVSLELPVGDENAFVSWVLGLGDTAVVHGPPALRQAVIEQLEELAKSPTKPAMAVAERPLPPANAERPRPATSGLAAGERLRRLLAVLVHLSRVGEASIEELAHRFDMAPDELVHDLELAACCGVPPYTPDQLIELIIDDDRVSAFGLVHLAKPRRLTPEEGFSLAAAAKALSEVAGAGEEPALGSARAKLEAVLGESLFSMEMDQPAHLRLLQQAAENHEQVEIVYFSSAATEPSRRRVDPYQVVLREGRWYLDGYCHLVEETRRFQVDRVQQARLTGESFVAPERLDQSLAGPGAFIGGGETVIAVLAVSPGSTFGVEQVALGPLEPLEDGRLEARVLVGDAEGWFGRLMLRLGRGAEVLAPPQLRTARSKAARRALRRYS
jgi:predicted DNA-binding transcriptional regulator YafY